MTERGGLLDPSRVPLVRGMGGTGLIPVGVANITLVHADTFTRGLGIDARDGDETVTAETWPTGPVMTSPLTVDATALADSLPTEIHPSRIVVESIDDQSALGVIEVVGVSVPRVIGSEVHPLPNPATPERPDPILIGRQKIGIGLVLVALGFASVRAPLATLIAVNAALTVFFIAANLFKLVLIRRSLNSPSTIRISPTDLATLADDELPDFTVLVPVYREAAVLRQLMEGIAALDYPAHKLDVKVLIEEDDEETAGALVGIDLPSYVEVLTIPDIGPKGKPRACNHGLARARGKYLVIYDAEDRPERDQLRKVVRAFQVADPNVVCIQAKLNYFNRTQNVLTRWFTSEYSAWFDQLLPGLQSQDHAIPLGGTSNHLITARLRELGGWNAYNVTEDADLGMRIFRSGGKTAVVDSTTYEEANSRPRNWVRQRSRWAKGYMQTYLSQMRQPIRLVREMGWGPFVGFQLFFGAQTLGLLLNPVYWILTALWFTTHATVIEQAFPPLLLDVGVVGLFLGNVAFILTAVAGCINRRHYDDVKWALLVPIYWLMMSIGAWKGFLQLFFKPYYWEKTTHGFFLFEQAAAEATAPTHEAPESSAATVWEVPCVSAEP